MSTVQFARGFQVALLALMGSFVCQSAQGALVQYWTFDDAAGTTAASAVSGNTGILVPGGTGPTWVTSGLATPIATRSYMPSTAALSFNPTGPDYVNLGNIGIATTPSSGAATLSMWVRPTSLASDMRLYGQLSGLATQGGAARTGATGLIEIWTGSTWVSAAPAGSLSAGTWTHLAMVWTNNSVQTYVNGVPALTATSNFQFSGANFGLGARLLNTFGNAYNGRFDDVAIWNNALSAVQIASLASGASILTAPLPVPEPSSSVLLMMGACGLMTLRRRKMA